MSEDNEVTIDIDNTEFAQQFGMINRKLTPLVTDFLENNDIGDNVILFYFAGVVKEFLKDSDDGIRQAVLRFMFD